MRRKRKSNKGFVICLIILIFMIGGFFRGVRVTLDATKAEAVEPVKNENQELKKQLEEKKQVIAEQEQTIAIQEKQLMKQAPVRLSDDSLNKLIDSLFPKGASDRFRAILGCENATHDPKRINRNKDGSYDLGISQINSYWHKARVEKMFGQSFDEAMSDPVKNVTYASILYKEHKNFSPWVCDKLI